MENTKHVVVILMIRWKRDELDCEELDGELVPWLLGVVLGPPESQLGRSEFLLRRPGFGVEVILNVYQPISSRLTSYILEVDVFFR